MLMVEEIDTIEALVLGALQGLTEFLPVSSSGHLRLAGLLWGKDLGENALFEIFLHGVTLAIVLWVLRGPIFDLMRNRRSMGLVILSAGVTAVVVKGCHLDDIFENMATKYVLVTEAITGVFLIVSEIVSRRRGGEGRHQLTMTDAVVIGLLQGVAVLPGLSRSGLTIGTAILLGLDRRRAFDYSFLISIPAIGGAMLLKSKALFDAGTGPGLSLEAGLAGAIPAAVLGAATLIWLRHLVTKSLMPFGVYCLLLSLVGYGLLT